MSDTPRRPGYGATATGLYLLPNALAGFAGLSPRSSDALVSLFAIPRGHRRGLRALEAK